MDKEIEEISQHNDKVNTSSEMAEEYDTDETDDTDNEEDKMDEEDDTDDEYEEYEENNKYIEEYYRYKKAERSEMDEEDEENEENEENNQNDEKPDTERSKMDKENDKINQHNEEVARIRNNPFENNLGEIKNRLTQKHGKLLPPYTTEEVDKWNFVHLIPKDFYLYLTNISRKVYIYNDKPVINIDDNGNEYFTDRDKNLIIDENSFDKQQRNYNPDDSDDPYDSDDSDDDDSFNERHNQIIRTQLKIAYRYSEDYDSDEYYLSPDNIITRVDSVIRIKSSFTDFLYDNMGLEYRTLYTPETYRSPLEIYAMNYNFLRIMSGYGTLL